MACEPFIVVFGEESNQCAWTRAVQVGRERWEKRVLFGLVINGPAVYYLTYAEVEYERLTKAAIKGFPALNKGTGVF